MELRGRGNTQAVQYRRQRSKKKSLNYLDSLSLDYSNLEWKSIYNQDYQRRTGVHGGLYTEEIRPSPVFPEESRFN